MFAEIVVIFMTSHMVVDTSLNFLHGSGAQFGETAGSSRRQVHKGLSAMESAYVRDCVGRYTVNMNMQSASLICTYLRSRAQAVVANGNRVILRGEVATLITAKGETAHTY